jgi:DNA recombination protein RmuC
VQNLPVILTVFAAAAAIIAILFWRIKPQIAVDNTASDKRIAEEAERARALQAKLDAGEATLREALASAASAKATTEGANMRAATAEMSDGQARAALTALQGKYSEAEPLIAAMNEQKKAAEDARAEAVQRLVDLSVQHTTLQTEFRTETERAVKAEKDGAAAKAEAVAVCQRTMAAEAKLDHAEANVEALHRDLNGLKTLAAEAKAQREAAEGARTGLEQRLVPLAQKYDALQTAYHTTTEQASAAKADAEHLKKQINDMSRTIEVLEQNLTEERAKLNQALAKQQSDETAAHHFKNIGQAILEETLEQAKRSVGELAATFQKSSGAELEKHAEKITRTLEPLQAQLVAYDAAVESLKKGTQENYGSLREQLSELQKTERDLHDQAKALTNALSASPKVKGSYGEMILKQLVEFVGMQEKCHFETQASRETEEGRKIPDLVVSLPGGQKVLVDAKAVMDACVEAQRTQDDKHRTILLKRHCDNVRSRVVDLSSKNYFADHQDAVEAVVLFLPAENLYATAMENDPGLTEYAMGKNIIICGPNSLMLLLKVSNQLWRRAAVEKEVKDIRDCGERIYKAASDFVEKFAGLGKKIQSLESEYNSAVGTFEGRLLPAARRMSAFESVAGNRELLEIEPVKDNVREFKEATRQLAVTTEKLPGLVLGEFETSPLSFPIGSD